MWTYMQKTGELTHNGTHEGFGYSGFDNPGTGQQGKNNPDMQQVHDVGPIPIGNYTIGQPIMNTIEHGPFVLPLAPNPTNSMFGRAGFLIHGDSRQAPGTASRGCIIMPLVIREQIAASNDPVLQVIKGV